jgi:acetyltransferase
VITPYPTRYEDYYRLRNGQEALLRPIKPEDEPLLAEMFQRVSDNKTRSRFFHGLPEISQEMLVQYCHIDYDKEISLVAELLEEDQRQIAGFTRLLITESGTTGEITLSIGDPWQGQGLDTKLISNILEICKERNLEVVTAQLQTDDAKTLELIQEKGFNLDQVGEEYRLSPRGE